MSESIFETFTDERGNISVRISQEVQVLTREEANRIEAEYRRMQAENTKLRELARWAARILTGIFPYVDYSRCTAPEAVAAWKVEASKLGIEVDE